MVFKPLCPFACFTVSVNIYMARHAVILRKCSANEPLAPRSAVQGSTLVISMNPEKVRQRARFARDSAAGPVRLVEFTLAENASAATVESVYTAPGYRSARLDDAL